MPIEEDGQIVSLGNSCIEHVLRCMPILSS